MLELGQHRSSFANDPGLLLVKLASFTNTYAQAMSKKPSNQKSSPKKPKSKGLTTKGLLTNTPRVNKGVLIGASVAALASGAIFALTRSGRLFGNKGGSSQSTGDASASSGASAGSADQSDASLKEEVASNITSNPSTEDNFTDEGATGNND